MGGSLRGTELLPLAPSAAASNHTRGCGTQNTGLRDLTHGVARPSGCAPANVQVPC